MKVKVNNSEFKILVVDDVSSNVMLLNIILSHEKYNIITSMSGEEALAKVRSEKPDLIILDVMIPDIDGYEVAKRIRQMDSSINTVPIIFLTALNGASEVVKGFQAGGDDFVSKPFSKEELLIRVKHQISLVAATRIIEKQNNELKNTIKSRDKMYSVIAHDLRAPLGSIKMSLNMLMSNFNVSNLGEDIYDLINMANITTEETFILLDNLLKWTKSQIGRLNVVYQYMDLVPLAVGTLDIFSYAANNKNIKLSFDKVETMNAYGDKDMFRSVLRNLLSNAIKFTGEGGEIRLSMYENTEDAGETIVVKVKDNGCGISEDGKKKLLKADSHYSTFGTQNEEGSGLGLLLCVDFVEKMGGKLWFDSKENVGTTFYFTIPKDKTDSEA